MSNALTLVSLIVAFWALAVSWYAIQRGNRNASVAAFIALQAECRNAWDNFAVCDTENKKHYFAQAVNVLEALCAVQMEGSLVGVSDELLTEFANDLTKSIYNSEMTLSWLKELQTSNTTFKYITKFRFNQERRLPPL